MVYYEMMEKHTIRELILQPFLPASSATNPKWLSIPPSVPNRIFESCPPISMKVK